MSYVLLVLFVLFVWFIYPFVKCSFNKDCRKQHIIPLLEAFHIIKEKKEKNKNIS